MKNCYFLGSLLLAGAAAFSASAQESVTVNIADYNDGNLINAVGTVDKNGNLQPLESISYEGVTFTFAMTEESKTAPGLFLKDRDVRVYADDTMTITAPEGKTLTEITFNMTAGWYQYGVVTASTGTMLCNGGDTDVTMADKVEAKPYLWTADDAAGVESVTFTVAHDTFDGTKRGQFRFTSAVVELAGGEEEEVYLEDYLYLEGCVPTPSFEGPVNLEESPLGMAQIGLMVGLNLQVNPDCEEMITVYYNDEPMSYVPGFTADQEPTLPCAFVLNYGMGEDDPYAASMIMIALSEDPIVGTGYYYVEIPDGFFLWQGKPLEAAGLFYEIESNGEIIPAGPLSGYVIDSMPKVNSIIDINSDEGYSGVAMMMLSINAEGLPVDINRECEEDILLVNAQGEIISRIKASTDPYSEDYDWTVFTPYAMMDPFGFVEGGAATVMMAFFEEGYTEPGKYTMMIPDNFFVATDEEGTVYGFEGVNYTYTLVDGMPEVGSFNDMVYDAYPMPGEEINIESDEWNRWGVDSYQFLVDCLGDLALNADCGEPIVIKFGEEVIYEIPSTNTFLDGGEYVDIWNFAAFSDDADDDFGGNDSSDDNGFGVNPDDVVSPKTVTIYAYDEDTEEGVFDAGTYTLIIPDGYFTVDGQEVGGSTYTYYIVGDHQTAVDMFKAEKNVTVYTINGVRVLDNAPAEALRGLEKGFYVINGKKVIMK